MKFSRSWGVGILLVFLRIPALAGTDPGIRDTVYFCDSTLYFGISNSSAKPITPLRLSFYNDSLVQAITVPFIYNLVRVKIDSVSFANSRVSHVEYNTVNIDTAEKKILVGSVPTSEPPLDPGRGVLVTYWLSLDSSVAFASFDTTDFPPTNHLYFVNSVPETYTPLWAGPDFFSVTTYKAGDANNSGNADLADVVFLANFLLKFGFPAPPIRPSADANGDCNINLQDVIYLANFLLKFNYPVPKPGCIFKPCN